MSGRADINDSGTIVSKVLWYAVITLSFTGLIASGSLPRSRPIHFRLVPHSRHPSLLSYHFKLLFIYHVLGGLLARADTLAKAALGADFALGKQNP